MLIDASRVLASGWTSGASARDERGHAVAPESSAARAWSAVGGVTAVHAIERERASMPNLVDAAYREAILKLAEQIGATEPAPVRDTRSELVFAVESITHWNDAPGRTAADVVATCARAAQEVLAAAEASDLPEVGPVAGTDPGPVRVLIAEDEQPFAALLTMLVEANPRLRVVGQAYDGEEAVALARETVPDIALVDLLMPVMNGFEATRVLREASPATRVLIVTGSDAAADIDSAREAGAAGYVLKDAVSSDLIRVIASLLVSDITADSA